MQWKETKWKWLSVVWHFNQYKGEWLLENHLKNQEIILQFWNKANLKHVFRKSEFIRIETKMCAMNDDSNEKNWGKKRERRIEREKKSIQNQNFNNPNRF